MNSGLISVPWARPPPPPTIILDGAIKNRRIFERKESVFCLVHHYVNK